VVNTSKDHDNQFSDEETQRRFEAALRGARAVGHEPMKDIPPKRSMKVGKHKVKTNMKAIKKPGR